jgi:hypothetical protein
VPRVPGRDFQRLELEFEVSNGFGFYSFIYVWDEVKSKP